MNITITQDNSRVEVLGSNGASIIEKLYELAIDPNNTLTLEGNISSPCAYGYLVDYLNTNYGPDFIVSATNRYIKFQDDAVLESLLSLGVGDGVGITQTQLTGLSFNGDGSDNGITFKNNTDIESFEEFKYCTGLIRCHGAFDGCSNLKWISFPSDYNTIATTAFSDVYCNIIVPSLKMYLECGGDTWCFPKFGTWSIQDRYSLYIGDRNNKLLNVVVTSDITVPSSKSYLFEYCKDILTVLWQSNSNISHGMFRNCEELTSVEIQGNISQIKPYAFNNCKSLLSVVFPANSFTTDIASFLYDILLSSVTNLEYATSIGANLFLGCTSLTSVDVSGTSSIGGAAFYGCSSLSSITLPSSLFTIDTNAFYGCSNLTSLDLSTVTAIGKDAFRECPNLTSVKIGPSVNKLTYRALAGMPAQPNTVLYLPLITTSAESELAPISDSHYSAGCFSYNAFGLFNSQGSTNSIWGLIYLPNLTHPSSGWCAFPNYLAPLSSITVDLIYLKNISALGVGMFGGSYIKALVINSTTPPPLTRDNERKWDSFSRLMQADGIYVPDGCESAYATAWANVNPPETFNNPTNSYVDVLSKIKPMSLLSRYATELAWITAGRPVALIEEYMS